MRFPSIAAGSHMCNPNWADLAAAPSNNSIEINVIILVFIYGAKENTVA